MRRVDKMVQDTQSIFEAIRPAFYFAFIDQVAGGYRLECHLMVCGEKVRASRVSFHDDMEGVKQHIEEMKQRYPADNAPSVILDNIPKGG